MFHWTDACSLMKHAAGFWICFWWELFGATQRLILRTSYVCRLQGLITYSDSRLVAACFDCVHQCLGSLQKTWIHDQVSMFGLHIIEWYSHSIWMLGQVHVFADSPSVFCICQHFDGWKYSVLWLKAFCFAALNSNCTALAYDLLSQTKPFFFFFLVISQSR